MRHDYTLFKRYSDPKNKRGIRWYFYYYDDLGNRKSKATGKSVKYKAEEEAQKFLDNLNKNSYTLNEYTLTFFKWDECPWIKRQLAKGRGFSEGFASSRRRNLDLYILPKFGDRKLDSFNRVEIENWLIDLNNQKTKEPLANQTRNHILYTFRIVLREAEREGLIPFNCLQSVEPMSPESKKRDVFTKDELKKLFPEDLQEVERIWGRKEYVYLFYILATTGIRSGEVRALQWKHIIWGDPAGLKIERSVKNNETFGTTKTGTSRVVLLTSRANEYLNAWLSETPFDNMEDLIFFGQNNDSTVTRKTMSRRFEKAMERAEIKIEKRNLVIHSFRHTYNLNSRQIIPRFRMV